MRQSSAVLPCPSYIRLASRRSDFYRTYSPRAALADALEAEDCRHWYFLAWIHVGRVPILRLTLVQTDLHSVVAIGITRAIIFGWVLSFTQAEPLVYLSDITWYSAGTLFWHLVENVVGLLGCCVPTYAPLFKGLLQKRKTVNATDSSGLSSNKQTRPSAYRQNLDDEIPLAPGTGSGQASGHGSNNYPLEPLPVWDRRVDRCFN